MLKDKEFSFQRRGLENRSVDRFETEGCEAVLQASDQRLPHRLLGRQKVAEAFEKSGFDAHIPQ